MRSTSSSIVIVVFLLIGVAANVHSLCTDPSPSPSDSCSPTNSAIFGSCCLSNTSCATSTSVVNNNPTSAFVNLTVDDDITLLTASLTQLDFNQSANYPLGPYTIISAVPGPYTWPPEVPVAMSMKVPSDVNSVAMTVTHPWAGTYHVTFASTYCNTTNQSLVFTRDLFLQSNLNGDGTSVGAGHNNLICNPTSTGIATYSRCDCSTVLCFQCRPTPPSSVGLYTCPLACRDILSPKPVNFTIYGVMGHTQSTCPPSAVNPRQCTCPAVCGDNVTDSNEYCDAGGNSGTYGSCCTTNCLAPSTTVPSTASVTASCGTSVSFTTMQLTGTANYAQSFQIDSVSGVTGLTAVISGTSVVFNQAYTGVAVVTFKTLYCASTSQYMTFIRTVTMSACCGDSTVNLGEQCDNGASNGGASSCCTATCQYVSQTANVTCNSGTACRNPSYCSGSSGNCPSPTFLVNGTVCRASSGPCDPAETCNGVSAGCPSNVFYPSTTVCRASTSVCDAPEYCIYNNASCPPDKFYNSSVTCRASVGPCDVAEMCNGVNATCPSDSVRINGYVCRPAVDVCDVAETCNGVATTCPVDGYQPNTIICRSQDGLCDLPEYCSGTGTGCSQDYVVSEGTICRAAAGTCDTSEVCDGVSKACPADVIYNNTVVCRPSAGTCDIQELCTGTSPICPTDVFVSSSAICRPLAGTCDVADYCTGTSATCPNDVYLSSGTVCNPSSGVCQNDALCSGTSATCPTNSFKSTSVVCRSSLGPCDIPEYCTGVDVFCPANALYLPTHICSASLGPCMPDSYCNGTSVLCPQLPYYNSSVVCRPPVGTCDIPDYCPGTTYTCTPDTYQPVGYPCYNSTSTCEASAVCTGLTGTCPTAFSPNGSSCHFDANFCYADQCLVSGSSMTCNRGPLISYDDGLFCNGIETCDPSTGLKIAGTPIDCNDNNSCTIDTCSNTFSMCVHTPVANSVGSCGGGLGACTPGSYVCNGTGPAPVITCVGAVLPVAEICFNDIDDNCNGEVDEFCNDIPCNVTQDCYGVIPVGVCRSATCVDGICQLADNDYGTLCDDGVKCTTHDACDGTGNCVGVPLICEDFNQCTNDYCDEEFGWCVFDREAYEGNACVSTDLCSVNSLCDNQGRCVTEIAKQCSTPTTQCMDIVCNSTRGACEPVAIIGPWCDDGDACTYNDVCTSGGCVGSPKNCDDHNECTTDYCASPLGTCMHSIIADHCYIEGRCYSNGEVSPFFACNLCNTSISITQWSFTTSVGIACDDGNDCTYNDVCSFSDRECMGSVVDCSYLNSQCSEGSCFHGQCRMTPVLVGNICDDGLYCTIDDACTNEGTCEGTSNTCSNLYTSCTTAHCDETLNVCVTDNVPDYTRCSLNTDVCDGEEYCLDGVCTLSAPLNCTASSNVCVEVYCDSEYGCLEMPLYATACDDVNVCTIGDFCGGDSICYPGYITLNCDDGDPCTEDSCHADVGCQHTPVDNCGACVYNEDCSLQTCQVSLCVDGLCQYIAQPSGTRCSDDNACNGEEFCTGNGVCVSILQPDCDDGNECTQDACDPASGCVFTPITGSMCDDDNACTNYDQCYNGVCAGTPITCSESTTCMTYACYDLDGAPYCMGTPVNIDGSCTPDDLCLQGGICSSYGTCITHEKSCPVPTDCISSYTCEDGICTAEFVDEGVACNTENLCVNSYCNGLGACTADSNTTIVCPALSQCQDEGLCVAETGLCAISYRPNGHTCDDDDACTLDDQCWFGVCIGGNSVTCLPTSQCYGQGVCDSLTGDCSYVQLLDHSPCNDYSECTSTSMCIGGVCTQINNVECTDYSDNECYAALCDAEYGCLYEYLDGVPCDDGNACTINTTCLSGVCGNGTPKNCFNEYYCGASYCSYEYGCLFSIDSDCALCVEDSDCPYHPCKLSYCDEGTCAYDVNDRALDGCDDGIFCNGQEYCELGTCFLQTSPVCDDNNECTTDTCDYTYNQCVYTPTVNVPCQNIDDLCAITSQCDFDGHCLTLTSYDCDTSNPCRVSTGCDASLGVCTYVLLEDGSPCQSSDLCSDKAVCSNGQCVSTTPIDCNARDWCYASTSCIPETGACSTDGAFVYDRPCDDGNWCTLGDTCLSTGICSSGVFTPCDGLVTDEQCQVRVCTGENCTVENLDDGTPCSTGMPTGPCSGTDMCNEGQCIRTYSAGLVCREADLTGCDIVDVCVTGDDYCPEDVRQTDGVACEAGLFCYTSTCQEGRCAIDQPRDCSSYTTSCTEAYCDESAKQCNYRNLQNGLPCLGTEFGQCVSYSSCYFGTCQTYYSGVNTPCDDGNVCSYGDHCSGFDSTCMAGRSVNCSYMDTPCARGMCNPLTGVCFQQGQNDGDPCTTDSNPCTGVDICQSGVCIPGDPLDCSYLDSSCQHGECVVVNDTEAICSVVITGEACSPNACSGNCTVPFEWWSVHNSKCPGTRQFTWPQGLEKAKICDDTYYDWSQKRQGSIAWRLLFDQWLAATLNHANGACLPNNTLTTLTDAYSLLLQCNMDVFLSNVSASSAYKSQASTLYSYNSGTYGPGVCDPTGCSIPPYGDTTCLFLAGTSANTTGDGWCINGMWNEGLLSCECYIGWTGPDCADCAAPVDISTTYVCVPSFNSPWAYTLRAVPNATLAKYIGDTKQAYHIVQMTGRAAVLPGTNGLDCACKDPNNQATDSVLVYNVSVGEDDIYVYMQAINSDMELCTQFFDIIVSNNQGTCNIDGVYCIDEDDTDWTDICDCCREDDDSCACPHNDRLCLRRHLIDQIAKADRYETAIIVTSIIGGIAVALLLLIMLYKCFKTTNEYDNMLIGYKLQQSVPRRKQQKQQRDDEPVHNRERQALKKRRPVAPLTFNRF